MLFKETVVEYKNGGKIETYGIIDKTTDDYKRIENTAIDFAERGEQVVITPKFDSPKNCPDYDKIHGSLKGTKYYGKCPDLKIGDLWYEHEGFSGKNPIKSFRNMCNHGLKQSDKIIIEDCGLTEHYMLRSIYARVERREIINEVWIHKNNEYILLYKAESQ